MSGHPRSALSARAATARRLHAAGREERVQPERAVDDGEEPSTSTDSVADRRGRPARRSRRSCKARRRPAGTWSAR
eukprot:6742796-Alexandrium_andersonii.AAC.1